MLLRRESLWGHVLICGLLPFAILLLGDNRMEEDVLYLSIGGMAAGICWWFVWRRQRVMPEKFSHTPKALWVVLSVALGLMGVATVKAYDIVQTDEQQLVAKPAPSVIGSWIIGASATRNSLLLLNGRGRLVSYDRTSWRPTVIKDNGVVDFRQRDDGEWILSTIPAQTGNEEEDRQVPGRFLVEQRAAGRLISLPPVDYDVGGRPIGLAMNSDHLIVFADDALYSFDGVKGTWHRTTLSRALDVGGPTSVSSSLISGNSLYLGLNAGEWGGGLMTIDLRTGEIELLGRRQDNKWCDGPLDHACVPVTGLAPDPIRPGCLLASIGLSHLLTHGRIWRICDRKIEVVFERPIESPMTFMARKLREVRPDARRGSINTEAFFGIVATSPREVWAVGRYGLYRYDGKSWRRHAIPELQPHQDFMVSDAIPGLFLLTTSRNARVSMSGNTLMAIADSGR